MQHIVFAEFNQARQCFLVILAGLFAFILSFESGRTEERPFLMLDTGGHMAMVRDMIFTPDGGRLISASDDKTIRIWDVQSGKTLKIIRGQIDAGEGGKIFEMSLSRDGRFLAATGVTKIGDLKRHPIRIYDLKTLEIVKLLPGHAEPLTSIDFSPDGRFLVSGSIDDTAAVWDVRTGKVLLRLTGHARDVNSVRFSSDGKRIVTASDDGTLRLWRARDGSLITQMSGHTSFVSDVAFSPDGRTVSSVSVDGTIRQWDGRTGEALRVINEQSGEVSSIRYSQDGALMITGSGAAPFHPHVWDAATGSKLMAYTGHDNLALSVAFSRDRLIAASAGSNNNEIHLWDPLTGKLIRRLAGNGQSVQSAGFSLDGKRIAWGHKGRIAKTNELQPLEFVLRLPGGGRETGDPRRLTGKPEDFRRVITAISDLAANHRSSGAFGFIDIVDVFRSNQHIGELFRTEKDGYSHNSYSFMPNAQAMIAGGGQGFLTAYSLTGKKLGEYVGHSGDVWAIAISPDGSRLLSASYDQTLRLWNVATGENIVTLFNGINGEWVMWTPQGYFSASPDGDEYVGWHVNQGPDKPGRLISAAQLKRHFYRPDIVRRALELGSARSAIAEAPDTEFRLEELLRRKPPQLELISPGDGGSVNDAKVGVKVRIGQNIDPVTGFVLVVNGRRFNAGEVARTDGSGFVQTFNVPLETGANSIEITAQNAVGGSVLKLSLDNQRTVAERRGTLYLLSIGVDDYKFFPQDLKLAGADARAVHDLIKANLGKTHDRVESLLLEQKSGVEPNAANIKRALDMFAKARPEDTIVLFLAGHGINQGREYLFLPSDAKIEGKRWRAQSVVNWRLLQNAIERSQGRRVMLVDTCHAGNAFNPRLVKDADDANIAVFAATDAETLAQEKRELGHGVFTFAVLEGLKGKADKTADRLVNARELSGFVTERVKSLTNGKQEPTSRLPRSADFVLSQL